MMYRFYNKRKNMLSSLTNEIAVLLYSLEKSIITLERKLSLPP